MTLLTARLEEVDLNLKSFPKRLGVVCFQVLFLGKQVIILLILLFKKCLSTATASVHQYQIAQLQTYAGICLFYS